MTGVQWNMNGKPLSYTQMFMDQCVSSLWVFSNVKQIVLLFFFFLEHIVIIFIHLLRVSIFDPLNHVVCSFDTPKMSVGQRDLLHFQSL